MTAPIVLHLPREQLSRRSAFMSGSTQLPIHYTSVICWDKSRFGVYNFLDTVQLLWLAVRLAWSATHLAEAKNEIF